MLDFYTQLASEVLHKPYGEITADERQRAKKYVYARVYNVDTNIKYINTFTFHHNDDAFDFMGTVTTDITPSIVSDGNVLVYTFTDPHDAYINMCEACRSPIALNAACKMELPE